MNRVMLISAVAMAFQISHARLLFGGEEDCYYCSVRYVKELERLYSNSRFVQDELKSVILKLTMIRNDQAILYSQDRKALIKLAKKIYRLRDYLNEVQIIEQRITYLVKVFKYKNEAML